MAAAYSPWRRFLRKTMVNSVVNSDPPQAISDAKSRLVMACGEWPQVNHPPCCGFGISQCQCVWRSRMGLLRILRTGLVRTDRERPA